MMNSKISIDEINNKLDIFDNLLHSLTYARDEFYNRSKNYNRNPNLETEVDLLSSISYFDRFILPIISKSTVAEKHFYKKQNILIIGLDKHWRANEFYQLFDSLDFFNKLYVIKSKASKQSPDFRIEQEKTHNNVYRRANLSYYLSSHEELKVNSISFSSPGSINFDGLGEAIREIKELFHYLITFQFVRGFVDQYYYFKYDKPIERIEKKMKLRELIHREQSEERKIQLEKLEDYHKFLSKMSDIAKLTEHLESKGLAKGIKVEEAAIRSMAMLHHLGFDKTKINQIES